MYSFVYSIYFRIKNRMRRHGQTPLYKKIADYCEWFYNIPVRHWYEKFPSHKQRTTVQKREQKIVVSLTSFPKRIGTVWLTIETLLRQSVRPDEVILWLAESQFNGMDSLPKELLRLQECGLTIRFCEDLRSHKKYYYTLQEFPNDLVILADDDMFYPRDTIQKLLKLHKMYPEDICCISAEVMRPNFESVPSLWRNPQLSEHDFQHSDSIQAFTGSGTLIPPHALPEEVFKKEVFQKICPYADDLWIAFLAHRKGTKVSTQKKWRAFPICIYGTAEGSLYYINGEAKQNDVQWQNLLHHYGETRW